MQCRRAVIFEPHGMDWKLSWDELQCQNLVFLKTRLKKTVAFLIAICTKHYVCIALRDVMLVVDLVPVCTVCPPSEAQYALLLGTCL
jgi:hypothetical protein